MNPTLNDAPPSSDRATGYAWTVVALLFTVAILNYLDRTMLSAMVEPIRGELKISNSQIGLLTSVFLWTYAIVSPCGGWLADRFSRSGVIVASLFFWSVATFLSGYAHSFNELRLARALMGISEACYMPAALALVADYHRGSTRSLATGVHFTGIYAGAALGGLGGFLAQGWGWRFGFKVFGVVGICYAIVLLASLRDTRSEAASSASADERSESEFSTAILGLLNNGGFYLLFVVNILVGVFNWTIYTWLPTYLKQRFSLGLGAAGISATAYVQVSAFVGVLLAGALADRWRRRNRAARVLVPTIGYCIAGPCLILTGSTGLLVIAIISLIIVGLGRGSFDANHMPIVREMIDAKFSATAFGILNMISVAAGGVIAWLGGVMMDHHIDLSRVFQASGAAMCMAGVLLGILSARSGKSDGA